MSTARRIALAPELIWFITGFLDISDLPTLMRVSRHFFHIAGPLIWREVPNIEVLMYLVHEMAVQPAFFYIRVITLPDTLDLSRFKIYAPWVQQLEVFRYETKYQFDNSSKLVDIAAERLLLPNLRSVSLSTDLKVYPEDYKVLVELFVCPSLVEIRHMSDYRPQHYLTALSAHSLIQKTSIVCPGIRRLEVYPDKHDFSNYKYSNLVSSPDAAIPRILAGFSNLQSLSSTSFILKPAVLKALGSLPLLESLCILDYDSVDEGSKVALDEDFQVLDTWFPALRTLQIYDLHHEDIDAIWSQPPLVQKLRAVTIRCYPVTPTDDRFYYDEEEAEEEEEESEGQEWINKFIADLSRASPHIEELDLHFDPFSLDSFTYSLLDAQKYLHRLPLRSIRVQLCGSEVEL
ncbi:hypothetical protein BDV93DRAFT_512204 [Ceratobasidium sp. AG-I]|nr:hypothetical protein BDV93DRAFT_512204 [Ceratobasidium sp. AG-I]